ncbi:MAG: hypothetical protein QOG50_650, partial [Actinomycetota bacterium]|nr:hypothetical protein [Actinomycetota bacterium]
AGVDVMNTPDRARRAAMLMGLVIGVLAVTAFAAGSAGARRGSAGAISVRVSPTSRVGDGQAVDIHAQAKPGTVIYQLTAHLCTAGPAVRTSFDFGFQGARCTRRAVGTGDTEKSAEYGSGVTTAELDSVRVGGGSVRWVNELGYPNTIQCGIGNPCDLVVKIQISDETVFFTAPLCYGATCPAQGTGAPSASRLTSLGVSVGIAGAVVGAAMVLMLRRLRRRAGEGSSARANA